MPDLPLRIAILECDTPIGNTRTRYSTYGNVFISLLSRAVSSPASPPFSPPLDESSLKIKAYDVVTAQEYPDLDTVDALLLTGSKHNSFDNDPWIVRLVDFIRGVLRDQERVRVVGVCFGHQIIGRALGSEEKLAVGRSGTGWEVSVTRMELTGRGKELFGIEDLALHQMHRDIVYKYPPGVELLAHTAKCGVQGMYMPRKFITVQGHPEFTEDIVRELLVVRHEGGILNDEVFEDAMGRVAKEHDGVVVAQAFLRFLLE